MPRFMPPQNLLGHEIQKLDSTKVAEKRIMYIKVHYFMMFPAPKNQHTHLSCILNWPQLHRNAIKNCSITQTWKDTKVRSSDVQKVPKLKQQEIQKVPQPPSQTKKNGNRSLLLLPKPRRFSGSRGSNSFETLGAHWLGPLENPQRPRRWSFGWSFFWLEFFGWSFLVGAFCWCKRMDMLSEFDFWKCWALRFRITSRHVNTSVFINLGLFWEASGDSLHLRKCEPCGLRVVRLQLHHTLRIVQRRHQEIIALTIDNGEESPAGLKDPKSSEKPMAVAQKK